MPIIGMIRRDAKLWIERHLGWCPRAKALLPADPRRGRFTRPAFILLLPLIPAFISIAFSLSIPIVLPSGELQMAVRVLLIGIPVGILICYGRSTHDVVGTTLAGVFLFPLFEVYSQVLGFLLVPAFIMTPPVHWVKMFIATSPFSMLLGATGYLASNVRTLSLYIALALGISAVLILTGIR
jgi:hypothetical protein